MGTDAKAVVRLSIEERVKLEKVLNEPRVAKDRVARQNGLLCRNLARQTDPSL